MPGGSRTIPSSCRSIMAREASGPDETSQHQLAPEHNGVRRRTSGCWPTVPCAARPSRRQSRRALGRPPHPCESIGVDSPVHTVAVDAQGRGGV